MYNFPVSQRRPAGASRSPTPENEVETYNGLGAADAFRHMGRGGGVDSQESASREVRVSMHDHKIRS